MVSRAPPRMLLPVTVWMGVLMCSCLGLRVINSPENNCSQPGIQCTIMNSSCMDISWLYKAPWTPSAPSTLNVEVGLGQNEEGLLVPVLNISWKLAVDSSIQGLQGVEVSVLQKSTNQHRCVQFRFGEFPSQLNLNDEPWEFFYNNFEVGPGESHHITVQHLPRLGAGNSQERSIKVPGCKDPNMQLTDSCCGAGYCWKPNVTVESSDQNMLVTFDPRSDTCSYRLIVKNNKGLKPVQQEEKMNLQMDECSQRVTVTFPNPSSSPPCFYDIQIQPRLPTCENDCARYTFTEKCLPGPSPSISPVSKTYKRLHLCFIGACLMLILFIFSFLKSLNTSKYSRFTFVFWGKRREVRTCFIFVVSLFETINLKCNYPHFIFVLFSLFAVHEPKEPTPFVKTIWFVYSADHRHYVDLVINLAAFMRAAWGMEVILDQFHVQDISKIGPMPWLNQQKSKIEDLDGTILVLCSRGAQEKWKAMQIPDGPRVMLKEEKNNLLGDLFTPALNFIMTDYRNGVYDRYVVASFGELDNGNNVPSLFEVSPTYNLTQDLQEVYFRIQKQERHQSGVQFMVPQEGAVGYDSLTMAMHVCKAWQEEHVDWFEKETSLEDRVESEKEERELDIEKGLTCRNKPCIRYPEPGVTIVNPLINKPDIVIRMDPVSVDGPPSLHITPLLDERDLTVRFVDPQCVSEDSPSISLQEPLVDRDISLGFQSDWGNNTDSPHQSDVDCQPWHSDNPMAAQNIEFLMAEQASIFQQSQPDYLDDFRLELDIKNGLQPESGYGSNEADLNFEMIKAVQASLFLQNGGLMVQE
ncbi:interleukin-17 receptor A-like [Discoglossus pictus]